MSEHSSNSVMERLTVDDVRAHVLGEALLAWKAKIVVPSVAEKKRVDSLRVCGQFGIAQDEVRELREAVQRNRVGSIEPHVLLDLFEPAGDVLHRGSIAPASPAPSLINS